MHVKCKSLLGFVGVGAATLAMAIGTAGGAAAVATQSAARQVRPATLGHRTKNLWSSSNWSGYAIGSKTTASGTYTSISGTWKVPTVKTTNSGTKYSAQWIGIDGYDNTDLIQTGTEADWIGGKPYYGVWWEILPASETPILKSVEPGQTITASIVENTSTSEWTITISNGTWTFTKSTSYSGPGESAEWIVEAPEVGGSISTIANTSRVYFHQTTVNGANPQFAATDGGELKEGGTVLEVPSLPSSKGDAFMMSYGAKIPPTPRG